MFEKDEKITVDNNQVSFEELPLAVNFTQDALIMLLERKRIVTREEVLHAIKEMKEAEPDRKKIGGLNYFGKVFQDTS